MNHVFRGFLFSLSFILALPTGASAGSRLASSLSLNQIVTQISNPKDLAKFMRKNFRFVEDQDLFGSIDYWQTPEEFWGRKKGDCEDYALFTQYVLKRQGKEAHVISLYGPEGYGHTVTIFRDEGRYQVLNEDRLYRYKAQTLEDAITRINPRWTWASIAARRGTRGWMVQKINNPKLKR